MSFSVEPWLTTDHARVYHGDSRTVLQALPGHSVDAIITDPPYELTSKNGKGGFMGNSWDATGISFDPAFWMECLRVLKPGGHLLAFGGTRTYHRIAVAIEDAGFEIRDSLSWQHTERVFCQCVPDTVTEPFWLEADGGLWPGCRTCEKPLAPPFAAGPFAWTYATGFPKSQNVATAVDQAQRRSELSLLPEEAQFCAWMQTESGLTAQQVKTLTGSDRFITGIVEVTNTATKDAPRYGRRAMVPTSAAWAKLTNAMTVTPPAWVEQLVKSPPRPTGGTPGEAWKPGRGQGTQGDGPWAGWGTALKPAFEPIIVARKPFTGTLGANVLEHGVGGLNIDACRVASGRWPTNLILDDTQAEHMDARNTTSKTTSDEQPQDSSPATVTSTRSNVYAGPSVGVVGPKDNSGNSTSFQVRAFPTTKYRDSGNPSRYFFTPKAPTVERPNASGIKHPTVKPLALMRYLVRLITPPGGTVLDPFAGSGTTLEAALQEGCNTVGIELTSDYLPLITQRIDRAVTTAVDVNESVAEQPGTLPVVEELTLL